MHHFFELMVACFRSDLPTDATTLAVFMKFTGNQCWKSFMAIRWSIEIDSCENGKGEVT